MPLAPQSLLDNSLTDADQHVAEAEQRRDRQIDAVVALPEGTQARVYAEHVLDVMERNLSITRAHQSLVQHLHEIGLSDCDG